MTFTKQHIVQFATALGLTKTGNVELFSLSGGVSSDVWKAVGSEGTICIKQALPSLRVAQRWDVPVQRSDYEVRWLEAAALIVPGSAPRLLGYEPRLHLIAMEYFPPEQCPTWQSQLMEGRVECAIGSDLGHVLGRLHSQTADKSEVAARFASDILFDALRLDPYFRSLKHLHPDLSERLEQVIQRTAATRRALVHGDVSPKNVLTADGRAVLFDGECAWFGDPAFDVAFMCTHLLLKMRHLPALTAALKACVLSYLNAYESHVHWESTESLRGRSADLLAALLLARVDGKSPVNYLSAVDASWVRTIARGLLKTRPSSPQSIVEVWCELVVSKARDF